MNKFNNAKYPRLAIRLTEELRDELDRLALANDMSVSELVKNFINVGIALQKKKKK